MIKAKKALGQNFLKDDATAEEMVAALDLSPNDTVLEIGPGLGVLTNLLGQHGARVIAVELDKSLVAILQNKFRGDHRVEVVDANILDWLPSFECTNYFKVIGSLPYYITSPIIHAVIKRARLPITCVFMLQKEVAQKICAEVPDASYLSTFVQTFYEADFLRVVDRKMFDPIPKVDGGIVRLTYRSAAPFNTFEEKRKYEGFLHKGFANPRKMINKAFSKEELAKSKIPGNVRPQNLSVDDWVSLFFNGC